MSKHNLRDGICTVCDDCDEDDAPNAMDSDLVAAQKSMRRNKKAFAAGKPTLSVSFGDLLKGKLGK